MIAAPLFLVALIAPPQEADVQDEPAGGVPAWTWSAREERAIRKLEKKVEQGGDGKFRLKATAWHVETFGSARLAAELGFYLAAFEESVLEQLGARRSFSVEPEVVVLSTYAEFQEKAPLSPGAGLVYEAVDDGRGKNRTRILENTLYTVVEDQEILRFEHLPLPELRAQAAKAILIGVFGRPDISLWFEAGVQEFFRDWDLADDPRAGAYERRRGRSRGVEEIRLFRTERRDWLPAIEKLIQSTPHKYRDRSFHSEVTNEAWSESVVDLLLTERRARSLRDDVVDEILRVGMSGSGSAIISEKTANAIARLWERHVREVLAPIDEG